MIARRYCTEILLIELKTKINEILFASCKQFERYSGFVIVNDDNVTTDFCFDNSS